MSDPKSKSAVRREHLLANLDVADDLPPARQLDFFATFASNMPKGCTALFELFDSIPKFFAGSVTNLTEGQSLPIAYRKFIWNNQDHTAVIEPSIIESRGANGEPIRKEVLPGEREEYLWIVLRKMAGDVVTRRDTDAKGLMIQCSLTAIRRELAAIGHDYCIWEIREALQILNKTAIKVTNRDTGKQLLASNYITVNYVADPKDETGERSLCQIILNRLAGAAIFTGNYDHINYARLTSLDRPLSRWLYERLVLNYRQAGAESGYEISLSLILREGPHRLSSLKRKAIQEIRFAMQELAGMEILPKKKKGAKEAPAPSEPKNGDRPKASPVLDTFRPYTEAVTYGDSGRRGGQRPIEEIVWTLYPSEALIGEMRSSNTAKSLRLPVNAT